MADLDIQLLTGIPASSPHATTHEKGGDDAIATLGNLRVDDLTVSPGKVLQVDTLQEITGDAGLTIDGVLVKDSLIAWAYINKAGSSLADLASKPHSALTDVTSDLHHAQDHKARHQDGGADEMSLVGLMGLIQQAAAVQTEPPTPQVGMIWLDTDATPAAVNHGTLVGVTANQHHAQAHTLASHSTRAHSELTGVTANLHHPQAHTLASHSTKAHGELTGITSGQHHAQAHTLASHSTRAHSELTGVSADQHHAQCVQHGYGQNNQSVPAASNADITITLSGNLTGVPAAVVASITVGAVANSSNVSCHIIAYTQTYVTVRVRNDCTSAKTFYVHATALRAA